MKNEEKYKTADERWKAFADFCDSGDCRNCELQGRNNCLLLWLEMEAPDDKPLSCPFCGSPCELHEYWDDEMFGPIIRDVRCTKCDCRCPYGASYDEHDAIAAHNRIVKAVQATKEGETK